MTNFHGSPEHTLVAASIRWIVPGPERLASRVRELLWGTYVDLMDADEMHWVGMTAHELLENVVKYSTDGGSNFDFEIVDGNGQRYVRIWTSNNAAAHDVHTVKGLLRRMSEAPNPIAVYNDLLATSADRKGSGLGLARIRAEADMRLDCVVELNRITIVAERNISVRGAL